MNALEKSYLIPYMTLRQMTGWAGLLLPFVVNIGAYTFENVHTTGSISAYYYTGMRDVFVSTLVVVGALLACYRTPAWQDNVLAIIAGLAAIGIGLFPMDPAFAAEIVRKHPEILSEKCYLNRGLLGYHFIFVTIFFAILFYLVFFRFGAFTPDSPTAQKKTRNKIYKVCGIVMLLAFLTIGYFALTTKGESIFWPEAVAVVAFSTAWLVKGRIWWFKDRMPNPESTGSP